MRRFIDSKQPTGLVIKDQGIPLIHAHKGASRLSIWAALLAVYLIWGSTYLAIRIAVETLPAFLMASVRFLIAGGILFAFRRVLGDPTPSRAHWRSAAIIGVLMLVGGNGMVSFAEQRVPSGIAALMVGSAPLWMVALDLVIQRRRPGIVGAPSQFRPTRRTILGVLVGFIGIAILVSPSELTGMAGGVDVIGALVLTLASFCWAAGSLYSRGAELPASPLLGTSMEMLAGGAGLLILGSLTGEWGQLHLASVSLASLGGLVYLILFGSLVGYTCYTWLLRSAPTALVSTYAYVNPLVAIFLGSLVAQEPVTPRVLIATAVILGAVVVITFTQPAVRHAEPQPVLSPSSGDD
jgi:drug/metabolite transporter (DMT)-like permease